MNVIPFKWRLYFFAQMLRGRLGMRSRRENTKIFCIGLNKTGTTSWTEAMHELGYRIGNERCGEILLEPCAEEDYVELRRLCETGEVFQDIPFNLPGVYRAVHSKYPDAKFVLTVRNSTEQWYASITRFHGKLWSSEVDAPPSPSDLRQTRYIHQGWPAIGMSKVFQMKDDEPYARERLCRYYEKYNREAVEYFENHKDQFIILNVGKKGELNRLREFLNKPQTDGEFPWKNKT